MKGVSKVGPQKQVRMIVQIMSMKRRKNSTIIRREWSALTDIAFTASSSLLLASVTALFVYAFMHLASKVGGVPT